MSYTPTSALGIACCQLRKMLAQSAAFQAGCGVDTEGEAAALITIGLKTQPIAAGGCIFTPEAGEAWDFYASGSQFYLKPSGALKVQIVTVLDASDAPEVRYLKGIDFVGNTAKEMASLSDAENPQIEYEQNHLRMPHLTVDAAGPGRPEFDNSRGLIFVGLLTARWGDD